ncbi:MAG: 1-acyl-sn-glycerol-3-phosphate acyltransferase [Epulopiscium sp.]|jgi:1-acyl-sn-glycerol-3-phosphate acyltransferase|nr:1-acyl-sn-glycerol-3-phosphate acyltransferase [Candidatus Epulonipiscium sp.]
MLYLFARSVLLVFYKIFFRMTVIGKENVPKEGAAILCANHISNYDPITMAIFLKRLPHYMAKKELFSVPVVGWLIRHLNAFPVDRSTADMNAFKMAVKVLKSGELVGMFAQGTRVKEGEEKAAKAGVALFAMKADVPVIPVAISGSCKLFSHMTIEYGEPLYFEEYRGKRLKTENLEEITSQVMEKIQEMRNREA